MKVYFPSNFGDISIEKLDEEVVLVTTELSLTEREVVKDIMKKYRDIKIDFGGLSLENREIRLGKIKIEDVHKFLKKKLKGNKPTLTAIKFKDGRIQLSEEIIDKNIEKAVTVEKPRLGCPMPEVMKSEVRASEVLKEFLTDVQLQDFVLFGQFVSKGNFTEKNYLITSRWSPKVKVYGQLYDLVDSRVICANCMEIPPSEELLSLKLSVELNEKEFLRIS